MKAVLAAMFMASVFSFSAPQKFFSGSFTITSESTKNKEAVTTVECYVKGPKLLAITAVSNNESKKMKMMVDGGEQALYYLNDDNKTAMKISLAGMNDAANTEAPKITVTDEYKIIDGYKCRKTNEINKTSTSEIWTTEDLDMDFTQVAKAFARMSRKKDGQLGPNYGLTGFPIKIVTTENGSGYISIINYKDIKAGEVDDSKFDLSGYKITDMPTGAGK